MNWIRGARVVKGVGTDGTGGEPFLDALYRNYYQALLHYALRLTNGDRYQAEDITQETLLRAWQHADSLDPENSLRWLYTVAHNLAISMLHRKARANTIETDLEHVQLPAVDDDLDRVLESWQVLDALAVLREHHRTVLIELFYHRRSVPEAATVLGIPAGTVKSRSHYALRALRDALQERGVC